MFDELLINLLNNFGFPAFVTGILLWDKIKSNGSLIKVVENNNQILNRIERRMRK